MVHVLDVAARAAIDRYLELIGQALGGACAGIYLTGSAALGDWLPGRSDPDFRTVTNRSLDEADLDALAALHEQYLRCGIRSRDDTGYMRRVDPGYQRLQPRW